MAALKDIRHSILKNKNTSIELCHKDKLSKLYRNHTRGSKWWKLLSTKTPNPHPTSLMLNSPTQPLKLPSLQNRESLTSSNTTTIYTTLNLPPTPSTLTSYAKWNKKSNNKNSSLSIIQTSSRSQKSVTQFNPFPTTPPLMYLAFALK